MITATWIPFLTATLIFRDVAMIFYTSGTKVTLFVVICEFTSGIFTPSLRKWCLFPNVDICVWEEKKVPAERKHQHLTWLCMILYYHVEITIVYHPLGRIFSGHFFQASYVNLCFRNRGDRNHTNHKLRDLREPFGSFLRPWLRPPLLRLRLLPATTHVFF